jgi:hypothetical protein
VAKTAKNQKTERQAVVDKMLAQQKAAERARGIKIVGVCVVIALLIVGAAAYGPVKEWWYQRGLGDLDTIGAPAAVCGKVTTKDAEGNQDHVPVGTPLTVEDAPPAFGQHYDVWESMDRKFYSTADRPELGKLIHNLEHGFTILWYDETAADDADMMSDIKAIAKKFEGDDSNFRNKFKAAPWLSNDGKAFPDGQHIAFTHWSAGGTGEDATGQQVGVWQYCSEPSGEALQEFMEKYPYMDSPEPDVA